MDWAFERPQIPFELSHPQVGLAWIAWPVAEKGVGVAACLLDVLQSFTPNGTP